jgi:hypothetical protein
VLNQSALAYYADESEQKLLGVLLLEDCKVVVTQPPHIRKERSHPSSSRRVLSPRNSGENVSIKVRNWCMHGVCRLQKGGGGVRQRVTYARAGLHVCEDE